MADPLAPVTPAQQNQKLWVLGLGIVGGLFIGSWGVSHLFGEGLDERERKQLLTAGGVGVFMGAMMLLDVDEKWWNVEKTAAWAEGWVSQQAGAK